MFIRASIQKKKTQTEYKTFKLVESFRTERGPRQRTVLNLGTVIHIRKSSRPEPHQKVIYDALNIPSVPGRMVKKIL
jgi:hypothetical protein